MCSCPNDTLHRLHSATGDSGGVRYSAYDRQLVARSSPPNKRKQMGGGVG